MAALTHFSPIFWRFVSSVVVIRRPPFSSAVQVGTSSPHSLVVELLLDGPDEVRRDPVGRLLRRQDDLLVLGRPEVGGIELAGRQRIAVALGHQVEDLVPALDDLGVFGHDEGGLAGAGLVLGEGYVALLDRVQDEVVVRRRLRQPGEDRRLGDRQVVELLAEVRLGGGLDPVALVAVVVLVEVGGDDLPLALDAGVGLGQADRLDDLLELPLDLAVRVLDEILIEQALADELLGDRRGTPAPAADAVDAGGDDRQRIEARVLPERLVLDRGLGVDDDRRDVLERDDLPARLAEPGELGLARPVVDDRLFLERELVEVARLGKARRQAGERRHGRDRDQERDACEQEPDDEGDVAAGGRACPLPVGDAACGARGFVQEVTPAPRCVRPRMPSRAGSGARRSPVVATGA